MGKESYKVKTPRFNLAIANNAFIYEESDAPKTFDYLSQQSCKALASEVRRIARPLLTNDDYQRHEYGTRTTMISEIRDVLEKNQCKNPLPDIEQKKIVTFANTVMRSWASASGGVSGFDSPDNKPEHVLPIFNLITKGKYAKQGLFPILREDLKDTLIKYDDLDNVNSDKRWLPIIKYFKKDVIQNYGEKIVLNEYEKRTENMHTSHELLNIIKDVQKTKPSSLISFKDISLTKKYPYAKELFSEKDVSKVIKENLLQKFGNETCQILKYGIVKDEITEQDKDELEKLSVFALQNGCIFSENSNINPEITPILKKAGRTILAQQDSQKYPDSVIKSAKFVSKLKLPK